MSRPLTVVVWIVVEPKNATPRTVWFHPPARDAWDDAEVIRVELATLGDLEPGSAIRCRVDNVSTGAYTEGSVMTCPECSGTGQRAKV